MLSRFWLPLCLLLVAAVSYAQEPNAAERKKHGIKKMTQTEQGGEGFNGNTSWLYDSYGNDTAMYSSGVRSYYQVIDYDTKGRIKKITRFSNDGKETENTVYSYKPDGSFTSKNTDTQFGLVTNETYDTKGRILKYTVPDGSVRHYVYNSKGQLAKFYSVPKNDGVKINNVYTYDAKGKLISMKSSGDYPAINTYEYDEKGLLKKSTSISDDGPKKIATVFLYSYEF